MSSIGQSSDEENENESKSTQSNPYNPVYTSIHQNHSISDDEEPSDEASEDQESKIKLNMLDMSFDIIEPPINPEEEPLETKYEASIYEDFDTIDWIRDSITDRLHHFRIDARAKNKNAKITDKIYRVFYRTQGWIFVTWIAVVVGFIAGWIDVAVDFLGDTRFGYCNYGNFLSKKLCCQSSFEVDCQEWITWNAAFGAYGFYWGSIVNYFVYIFTAIIFATLAGFFVKQLAQWASGSGIPEVKTILGGFVIRHFAGWQTLLVKISGLVLAVSSGLSLGKEGPLVHVSACVCEVSSRLFPKYYYNQAKLREMISASAAAGVSVAFGAPIGGVLFSLEEVSYYFPHKTMWRAFYCATIAALVLQFMDPFHNGKLIIFQVNYTHSWYAFELFPFLLLGFIGGILGAIFIRMNLIVCKWRRSNPVVQKYCILEAGIVAGVTAIVCYWNDYLRANTSEIISGLYAQCNADEPNNPLCNTETAAAEIVVLLFATFIRFGITVFTFGVKVPAGLFIPSLAIGASFGHALGLAMSLWQSRSPDLFLFQECKGTAYCVDPGVYALIGSAAMLGGVTRMTVSLVVIMFEITGDVNFIVPIMLAVMVAKWIGDAIGKESIYDEHILFNGYPYLDPKQSYRFANLARHIMKQDLVVLELRPYTFQELSEFVEQNIYSGWPIVTKVEDMFCVGFIARSELKQALKTAKKAPDLTPSTLCFFASPGSEHSMYVDLRPWMDSTPTQVTPRTPINIIFDMFKKMGMRYVLVANRGRLVGIITKKDILQQISVASKHRKLAKGQAEVANTIDTLEDED